MFIPRHSCQIRVRTLDILEKLKEGKKLIIEVAHWKKLVGVEQACTKRNVLTVGKDKKRGTS